jgi:hypothetical protein
MTETREANKSGARCVFTGKVVAGMRKALLPGRYIPELLLLLCAGLAAQTVPMATDLPSRPFFIKATWYIGGTGNWDYLTMDPQADRLYIAHGTQMQVVDTDTGSLVGTMDGFYEVRQIVLDDTGQLGFISDGGQGKVTIFDRQTLKRVAEIEVGANPRSMVYDPLTRLLFVVRTNPPGERPSAPQPERPNPPAQRGRNTGRAATAPQVAGGLQPAAAAQTVLPGDHSALTVIDTQTEQVIGEVQLTGLLGYAVGDANGEIFVSVTNRSEVYRLDTQDVATLMHASSVEGVAEEPVPSANGVATVRKGATPLTVVDWTPDLLGAKGEPAHGRMYSLGGQCSYNSSGAGALAYDDMHQRLFVACASRTLMVLNPATGETVATLPTGPGVEAVGYDSERGLIFTANGGAEGSVTIIRQDVTDSYAVIETLPTRQRAGTLAVNPVSGAVYLVTDYLGVDLNRPGGIGTLEAVPVKGSFQVLTVGN